MDPPPPLQLHPTTTTTTLCNSVDSSGTDNSDEPLQPVPGAKMRLMCNYGGHIIPRPPDQSLCYVGGDTRMVVVDRNSSLSSLSSRLSRTLFHGRQFTLKYQLPDEDLDSLISVATDDDLENMIEEYDRTVSVSKTSRLRLFLFLAKPETAASMGSLLNDAKSESWFVDALNGAALLPRGLSDPTAIDNMLEFDGFLSDDHRTDKDAQNESLGNFNKQVKNLIDVQSNLPDSPAVETNSSFGSNNSSPLMSNLPPLKVRVENQVSGLDERFSHMTVAAPVHSNVASGENPGRVSGDDDRSDQAAASGFRKPPLPSQIGQRKVLKDSSYSPLSPDSVASDNSIASATSLSKQTLYQDPAAAIRETKAPAIKVSSLNNLSEQSPQILMNQFQQIQQQQQFLNTNTPQYIHHPPTNHLPVSSYYYPHCLPPSPQQYHQQVDQQYRMYLMPVTKTQPYNVGSTDGQAQLFSANSVGYKEPGGPPIFQTMTAGATMVQVQPNHFQRQYGNVSQMSALPLQPINNGSNNYGFDQYAQQGVEQVYYAQHSVVPSQTMTPATAVVMISQAQAQESADNTKFS